ncbi:MAG: dephospho-CoA kinase [Actinomycetota bacterium]|nr:dephospho-CoA kinase [Actinomycetota bacterium]
MLIALTGGIGSGKSTVARRWVELGATEIDADVLAREVVAPGSAGLALVAKQFGSEVLASDGTLDRAALAKIAFSSEENRKLLESILHPLIQQLALEKVEGLSGVIVYTIPLFVESNSKLKFDKVVTISCDEAVRVKRLVESRGMSQGEAISRISAQASDAQREAVSDIVIDSNCTMAELVSRADSVFESFKESK